MCVSPKDPEDPVRSPPSGSGDGNGGPSLPGGRARSWGTERKEAHRGVCTPGAGRCIRSRRTSHMCHSSSAGPGPSLFRLARRSGKGRGGDVLGVASCASSRACVGAGGSSGDLRLALFTLSSRKGASGDFWGLPGASGGFLPRLRMGSTYEFRTQGIITGRVRSHTRLTVGHRPGPLLHPQPSRHTPCAGWWPPGLGVPGNRARVGADVCESPRVRPFLSPERLGAVGTCGNVHFRCGPRGRRVPGLPGMWPSRVWEVVRALTVVATQSPVTLTAQSRGHLSGSVHALQSWGHGDRLVPTGSATTIAAETVLLATRTRPTCL